MTSIPQDAALMVALEALLQHFRPAFRQGRVFRRVIALIIGEMLTLGQVTQILIALGWVDRDWSA